jgi:hypothetical protein
MTVSLSKNIVDLLYDKKRSDALDKINDLLKSKTSQALDDYKKIVASTFFDEPIDTQEDQ